MKRARSKSAVDAMGTDLQEIAELSRPEQAATDVPLLSSMNSMTKIHPGQRIVFLGTPEFAVGTLNALVSAGMNVVAVVTAPDRPAGRGLTMRMSAVKLRALELGLPVLQPERLKAPEFLAELAAFDATVQVVVAFRMLPEAVWDRPALGTINLHASLLPQYRGAAPINWAIINGESVSGVTTFRIQQVIDTGDMLLQECMAIGPDETAGELHDRMMTVGATLMVRTLTGLFEGTLTAHPQESSGELREAPKLTSLTGMMPPDTSARRVHDLVRGLSPYPAAWCMWQQSGKPAIKMKVFRTRQTEEASGGVTGAIRIVGDRLLLACSDHWLELLDVQPEGRKRMQAADFIRGLQQREGIRVVVE